MQRSIVFATITTVLLLIPGTAHWVTAQDQGAARQSRPPQQAAQEVSAAEQAIRATSQTFAKAFQSGDAEAIAAFFTEGAEYVDEESEPVRN